MRVLLAFLVCAALGCSGAVTNGTTLTTGNWGGPDLLVSSAPQGATTQFVCAHGTIDEVIAPDAGGNFSASGTYVLEHPAMIAGQPAPASHSARYDGQITGTTMRVSVSVPDLQQVFGPFVVTLGATGPNSRCQ